MIATKVGLVAEIFPLWDTENFYASFCNWHIVNVCVIL